MGDLSGDPLGCEVSLSPPSYTFDDGESYVYDDGTYIRAAAGACVGYRFDHWELDGVEVSTSNLYGLTIYSDTTLRAVYRVKESPAGPTSEVRPGKELSGRGFPDAFRYVAEDVDAEFNRNLLRRLGGPAQPGYEGPSSYWADPAPCRTTGGRRGSTSSWR